MLSFLLDCELPALLRGRVSAEQPRAMYTLLPTLRLRHDHSLAPIWSVFHILNAAHLSVYDDEAAGGGATGSLGVEREQSMEEGRVRHPNLSLPPGSVPTIAVRGLPPRRREDDEDVEAGVGVPRERDGGSFLGRLRGAVRDASGGGGTPTYARVRGEEDDAFDH